MEKGLFSLLMQFGDHRPILFGLKGVDLGLPVADHTGGYGLHAPGAQALTHLFPQKRADGITHQAVHHAAGLLGIN